MNDPKKLQKKLQQDIRDMFKLEAQRNDINFAMSGVEQGEMTIQDYEDDLSLAISNWIVDDLLPQPETPAKSNDAGRMTSLANASPSEPINTVGEITLKISFTERQLDDLKPGQVIELPLTDEARERVNTLIIQARLESFKEVEKYRFELSLVVPSVQASPPPIKQFLRERIVALESQLGKK